MTKNTRLKLLAVLGTLGFSMSAMSADVVVDPKGVVPYVTDSRNVVVTSGSGLCVQAGASWSPAAAEQAKDASGKPLACSCDPDLIAKEKCEPPKPAAPVARPAPKPAEQKVKLAADTLFDFDKATLRPEGKAKLDEIVSQLGKYNVEVILAVGHTDRIGSDAYNQKLSERRADAVKKYLISKGVPANRVYTEGKGEKMPVTGDKCKNMGPENRRNKKLIDCLQPDRRVEIQVIGTDK
ncbi:MULTISPECIES: OmpA family protein [Tepidiphilus]|jgi:OOP family OmpA-OmpF porin|uniref:Outer membrane protein OmpA and related peptidoglycan-associated (Lipo)proteins n=1 Tax=Tepidiphilus thermophilus TaxID=876478 RepID=A0A0K6IXN1_9PROT|nr:MULTISPECIES: OmpA family protein [Tepidiphilus]MDK2797292.1 OmpA-OmpF porin, family [Tepidiphilus sp.]CUB07853.1 Outer membrane protein OmpA and related peptidoglycan-associated (lipo)proteins [Tepidiphilus thermophilus]